MKQAFTSRQKTNPNLIRIFMFLGLLLLAVFLFWWIVEQYRKEETTLTEKWKVLVDQTHANYLNEFIQKSKLITPPLYANSQIVIHSINDTIHPNYTPPLQTTDLGTTKIPTQTTAQINLIDSTDKEALLSIIGRTINTLITIQADVGDSSLNDTLLSKVQDKFASEFPKIKVTLTDSATVNKDTKTLTNSLSSHTLYAIENYKQYILLGILPLSFFAIVILSIIGIGFLLSFRALRQQQAFTQQKDAFISNLSHELKTPVAATKLAIDELWKNNQFVGFSTETMQHLKLAKWEVERLSILLERIMQTLQLNNDTIKIHFSTIDLYLLLEELFTNLHPLFKERNIQLKWGNIDDQLNVMGDKVYLQGTLYNLIDNAIKYGGTEIKASLYTKDNYACIEIEDNGIGIEEEYLEKIFENFFRVPTGNIHTIKGHGLGLSFVKKMIVAHNGFINVKSIPNQGTRFNLHIPIAQQ